MHSLVNHIFLLNICFLTKKKFQEYFFLVGELILLGEGVMDNELILGEGRELLVNISLSNTGNSVKTFHIFVLSLGILWILY